MDFETTVVKRVYHPLGGGDVPAVDADLRRLRWIKVGDNPINDISTREFPPLAIRMIRIWLVVAKIVIKENRLIGDLGGDVLFELDDGSSHRRRVNRWNPLVAIEVPEGVMAILVVVEDEDWVYNWIYIYTHGLFPFTDSNLT